MADSSNWYLLKAVDQQVFGPLTLSALEAWATEAKISPMDKVSSDEQKSWVRAPMIPQLKMDWLIEQEDNYLYGPTTVGSIKEFLESGEINERTNVINCKDSYSGSVNDLKFFVSGPRIPAIAAEEQSDAKDENAGQAGGATSAPVGGEADEALQERIRELEAEVMGLRIEVGLWQDRFEKLQSESDELSGTAS